MDCEASATVGRGDESPSRRLRAPPSTHRGRFSDGRLPARLTAQRARSQAFMRELWFIFDAGQRGPELFAQGTLVTSKSRAARASTGKIAEVDKQLPAEAASCE